MMDAFSAPLMTSEVTWEIAAISCLLSFLLTQAISAVYVRTFEGLSYSRTMVQGMALGSIITCMLMLAIGNNIATALGIAGGLSIIRFRTTTRDPRDILFVFASLAAGIACGLRAWIPAVVGTGMFLSAAALLHLTSYGARREYDGLTRLIAPSTELANAAIAAALGQHCARFTLVTLREVAQGQEIEHAYQVSIPDPAEKARLITSLNAIDGVHDVAMLLQDPTLEL